MALHVFTSIPGSAEADLAREVSLLDRAVLGDASLFFYSWRGPVVVLGCGQREDTVDRAFCEQTRIPVVRRVSGGTGVLHCDDLAVSLVLPVQHEWAGRIAGLYDRFLTVLQQALRDLGIATSRSDAAFPRARERSPVCFLDQTRETLLLGRRKAVGCAQARRRGGVLVHASILLNLRVDLYARVFRVPPERIAASLAPLPRPDRTALVEASRQRFAEALG